MRRRCCLLVVIVLSAACAGPTSWWQTDLQEWQGAPVSELLDAWGPPLRMRSQEGGATELVYERIRTLDHRIEQLADPGAALRDDRTATVFAPTEHGECKIFFAIEGNKVIATRHEGAGCDVVPRDPARRRSDPPAGRVR